MANDYRYVLEKGSKKHPCPGCTKKTFVRYIDTSTGGYIPDQYGRCDREVNCGYQLSPYHDDYAKSKKESTSYIPPVRTSVTQQGDQQFPIPFNVLNETLQIENYEKNTFIQNLLHRVNFPFKASMIEEAISQYYLGTIGNGYREGAITFPFIDVTGKVRAVQVKQFNEANHTTATDFLHSIIEKDCQKNNTAPPPWLDAYKKNDLKVSCLFGEHLLSKHPLNPIALVEAPKTAVYGTLYFGLPSNPKNFLWLAVYNLSSLNITKCKALQNRNVILFPDLSKEGKAFELWSNRAEELNVSITSSRFIVSDFLEKRATETDRQNGLDLADYLILQDWKKFEPSLKIKVDVPLKFHQETEAKINSIPAQEMPRPSEIFRPKQRKNYSSWDHDITELESFFKNSTLPEHELRLNSYSTITNVPNFIKSHLSIVKAQSGNPGYKPYFDSLIELKEKLTGRATPQKFKLLQKTIINNAI